MNGKTLCLSSSIFVVSVLLFSCGQATKTSNDGLPTQDFNTQEMEYKKIHSQTLMKRDKAIELNGLWTTASSLLAKSEEAAEQSDYDSAIEYAVEAKKHIELSIQQAELEKEHWKASKDNIFN